MSVAAAPPMPTENPLPVWKQPPVRRLLIIALLAEIGYAVLNISTMPVYLAADPGSGRHLIPEGRALGPSVISFVLVAFLLSEAVFKSPMGALADRLGHRRLMLIGPIITTFTALLTMLVPFHSGAWEVAALILLRVADGIGAAMLWPAAFALMGDTVDDSHRQQAMSLLNLCYMLGIALAMPIGGTINDLTGHKWASLFLASAVFAAVALSVFHFVAPEESPQHAATDSSEIGFGDFIRSAKEIPGFLVLAIVTFAGIGFPMAVVKIFAQQEFHLSETGFGLLVFPAAIGMAVGSVPLSKYGEKVGRPRAVHLGMALCTLGLAFCCLGAIIPFFRSAFALAFGGIPVALGFLLAIPAWMASVSDIDPQRRGANLGAVMTAQGLGAIIGAPIGGALYEKLQPVAGRHIAHYSPFLGCMICVALGWLLSLHLLREKSDLPAGKI